MLTRAIRLVSLPMLALLFAISTVAHAAPNEDTTDCGSGDHAVVSGTPQAPRFTPVARDSDSVSHFEATRPISSTARAQSPVTAHIAVCRGSLSVTPSRDAEAHLTISLSKALPAGQLASSLIRSFVVTDSHIEVEIAAPEEVSPRIGLALPLGTSTELALVRGNLDISHLLGNAQIAIVKGNATLHLADADFSWLECATIMGGIHDRRPGGISHGHVLSTWTAHGTGSAKIEFSAVSGDLILLPPLS